MLLISLQTSVVLRVRKKEIIKIKKKSKESQKPNWVIGRKGRNGTKVWENYSAMLESCIVTESRNNRGTSQTET